ncbi:MAG TPA: DUF951 domain-containing protein [Dehalococcoidia bacterium]|nr:DUF951 domain-containing protein [Dehalococcoidia bacterium]
MDFRLGDVVRLRRKHPCGGFDWRVVRVGADIGLVCLNCGRRVLLERRVLEKRLREFLARGPQVDITIPGSGPLGEEA